MGSHPTKILLEQAEQKFGELSLAEKKLFTLAQETFQELSDSEYQLFHAIANGEVFTCQTGIKAVDKPANAANWGAARILRGDRLRWLCIEPEVWKLCLPQGIDITGAKIEGCLNLSFVEVEIPLRFFQCCFAEILYLKQAKLRQLELSGTYVDSIDAESTNIAGSVWLDRGFEARGMVNLIGASIGGKLDCNSGRFSNGKQALLALSLKVTGDVSLTEGFEAKGGVSLVGASIGGNLYCNGTFTREDGDALFAPNIQVIGSVFLSNGFKAKGEVNLIGATIRGGLYCDNGTFIHENKTALLAKSINVTGDVCLNGNFQAKGTINLANANIGGNLECSGMFIHENETALLALSINVAGNVHLNKGFEAKGRVNLIGATVGGGLYCSGGKFTRENETALDASNIQVAGNVFLTEGFEAKGGVSLVGANIGGELSCSGGKFTNENGVALFATSLKVAGVVFLMDGFEAKGEVSLARASIGGDFNCSGGTFISENGTALIALSLEVTGSVLLSENFEAKGGVSLEGASIRKNLICGGGTFIHENETALDASSIQVTGSVFLTEGFEAKGMVSLIGASVGGDLYCGQGKFINANGIALFAHSIQVTNSVLLLQDFEAKGMVNLRNARVENTLLIARVKEPEGMLLDLQFARIQTLDHREDSFPALGNLHLNGLLYEALESNLLNHSDRHLRWLRLQPTDPFSSQPYEHLAKILQSTGKRDEAVQVLIAREQDELKHGKLGWFGKSWERFLGITIAYGYKPERAIFWAVGVVLAGSVLFHFGYQKGLITPTEKDCKTADKQVINDCQNYPSYPKFNPVIYSLDVFLPIIDLRLKGAWLPNANQGSEDRIVHLKSGAWLRYYFWFQVISGWVLTTLWVAGFTGLVRNTNK